MREDSSAVIFAASLAFVSDKTKTRASPCHVQFVFNPPLPEFRKVFFFYVNLFFIHSDTICAFHSKYAQGRSWPCSFPLSLAGT